MIPLVAVMGVCLVCASRRAARGRLAAVTRMHVLAGINYDRSTMKLLALALRGHASAVRAA